MADPNPDPTRLGAAEWRDLAQALLPPGRAFPRDPDTVQGRFWHGLGEALADYAHRTGTFLDREAVPAALDQLLTDWERALGLPDECEIPALTSPGTTAERQAAVVEKLTRLGGQSIAFFESLAARLGYPITVTEWRPFICAIGRCGEPLMGGHASRFVWTVEVVGLRVTRFRAGIGRCGDRLGTVTGGEDLRCLFLLLKPAHARLFFIAEEI